MYTRTDPATKAAILDAIKNGMKVVEAAGTDQVNAKTIYAWLRDRANNSGTSTLEVAKLRRENQELKELIGLLTLQKKRAEKNPGRS